MSYGYSGGNKIKSLSGILEGIFDPENMGTGMKRGFVLKIYKAKIKEVMGDKKGWLDNLKGAKLKGDDDNPMLYIYLKSGSMWRNELHHRRYQIRMLINKRLKSDFVKEVRIK